MFIVCWITDPISVLTSRLVGPREANCLREVDEICVKKLKKMSKSQFVPFKKPLVCIVKGLFIQSEFKKETLDRYELEVIGGSHARSVCWPSRQWCIQDMWRHLLVSEIRLFMVHYLEIFYVMLNKGEVMQATFSCNLIVACNIMLWCKLHHNMGHIILLPRCCKLQQHVAQCKTLVNRVVI